MSGRLIQRLSEEARYRKTVGHNPAAALLTEAAAAIQSLEAQLAAVRAQQVPLTERQIVECIVKAGCIGTVKLTFDSGPYEVTRTTVNADKFAKAIEAAHGITAALIQPPKEAP